MDDVTTRRRGAKEVSPEEMKDAPRTIEKPADKPVELVDEYRHTLNYDIDAHGEKIRELVFREPTGADIVRYGNPIRLDLTMNEAAMETQMSALAAVPPSSIRQLKSRDWNTIAFELTGRFFVPALGARAARD